MHKGYNKFILFITLAFVVLVFVGSRDVADLDNYEYYFKYGYAGTGGQITFKWINDFFRYLGFSFDGYRFFISCFSLILYYKFVVRFSPLPNLVFAAYLSYLMIMDDVQIRNMLACSILYLALISVYIQDVNWKLKFLIGVILASSIHTAFWVYLIFLIVPENIYNDRYIRIIGLIAIIFSMIVLFLRDYLNDFIFLFAFLDEDKVSHFALEPTKFGGLLFVVIQFFSIFSILLIQKKIKKRFITSKERTMVISFLQVSLLLNILCLCFIPAVIFSITFYRLIRNLFFINICAFSMGYKYLKYSYISILMILVYIGLFFYFDLTSDINNEIILTPFFNKNIFFSI